MKDLSRKKTGSILFTFTWLVGLIGLLSVWALGHSEYSRIMVLIASTSFVMAGLMGSELHSWFDRLILLFLGLCWLGDILGPSSFLLGLAFFLIAHLALIAACCFHGISTKRLLWTLPLFGAISITILLLMSPKISSGETLPVILYTTVITAMVACTTAYRNSSIQKILITAAVLFYLSDLALALTRYVLPGRLFTYAGYPMYYTACLLFAWTPLMHCLKTRTPATE